MKKVKKAIIPVAGLGTRFLPASKTVPKEMLPIVDRPGILYTVEEAVAAGIEDIILVQGRGKTAIEDFFDCSYELEDLLSKRGKTDFLERVVSIRNMANFVSVRQNEALGLGHAVLCGQPIVGDEPFAVLLPDELMVGNPNVTESLVQSFEKTGRSTIAIMEVPKEDVSKYGIADVKSLGDKLYEIQNLVEKPSVESAPSQWALPGRYVFESELFREIEKTPRGNGGEIQLTDAMLKLASAGRLNGLTFSAKRYDTGDKFGFLQANVELALSHPDFGNKFREYLKDFSKNL